jgi:hypothetical protein
MAAQLIGPLQQRIYSPKSQKRRKTKRKSQSLLRLVLMNHTWMADQNPPEKANRLTLYTQ